MSSTALATAPFQETQHRAEPPALPPASLFVKIYEAEGRPASLFCCVEKVQMATHIPYTTAATKKLQNRFSVPQKAHTNGHPPYFTSLLRYH